MVQNKTKIDEIAEKFVYDCVKLSPISASQLGIGADKGELDDFSPKGHEDSFNLAKSTLEKLEVTQKELGGVNSLSLNDQITYNDITQSLKHQIARHNSKYDLWRLNILFSPLQEIRMSFDLMPKTTIENWEIVILRLKNVSIAIDQYIESLDYAKSLKLVSPLRQLKIAYSQAVELSGQEPNKKGFFSNLQKQFLSSEVYKTNKSDIAAIIAELDKSVKIAQQAYGKLAKYIKENLIPASKDFDPVGKDLYAMLATGYLGKEIDLEETYKWGISEVDRLDEQIDKAVKKIAGTNANFTQARDLLNEQTGLKSKEELQKWMQTVSNTAITQLDGTLFTIPEPVKTLDCNIAPTQDGGIYYTAPSENFSRPGAVWWGIPEGLTNFPTWNAKTTVYHEGFPGHHLQIATVVSLKEKLNLYRRSFAGGSGYFEGWALYAEQVMDEHGYLETPGERLGFLDSERMRSLRVVMDIGVHLQLEKPAKYGGGLWDYKGMKEFFTSRSGESPQFIDFEVNRYLGMPAQAISYKVGLRSWRNSVDNARARAKDAGKEFSFIKWVDQVLAGGAMGLYAFEQFSSSINGF